MHKRCFDISITTHFSNNSTQKNEHKKKLIIKLFDVPDDVRPICQYLLIHSKRFGHIRMLESNLATVCLVMLTSILVHTCEPFARYMSIIPMYQSKPVEAVINIELDFKYARNHFSVDIFYSSFNLQFHSIFINGIRTTMWLLIDCVLNPTWSNSLKNSCG